MAGDQANALHRAPNDDSSSVVLHARWTTFVMLIVSALVGIGALAEDDSALNRAISEARIVLSLSNLSKSARPDGGPVSIQRTIAEEEFRRSGAQTDFDVTLTGHDSDDSWEIKSCALTLDLHNHLFVRGQDPKGPSQHLLPRRIEIGGRLSSIKRLEGELWYRRLGDWTLKRRPETLAEFVNLWNGMALSRGVARVETAGIENYVEEGLAIRNGKFYQTEFMSKNTRKKASIARLTGFASLDEYMKDGAAEIHTQDFEYDSQEFVSSRWQSKVKGWLDDGYEIAAVHICRETSVGPDTEYLFVFPVKLERVSFDWISEWIAQAVGEGSISDDDRAVLESEILPIVEGQTGHKFEEVFSHLTRRTVGHEQTNLAVLPGILRDRLDREERSMEVAGIGLPRKLLRSVGLFLILITQFYAARHIAEAASRMETSVNGDPGAFQPWILLYNGPWTRQASFAIVVAPAAVALAIFLPLVPDPISSVNAVLSWLAFSGSIWAAVYAYRNVKRLRAVAQRHRTSAA